jgi:hypothetical protein
MDVRRTVVVAALALCVAMLTPFSVAQSRSGYDPEEPKSTSKPKDLFVDFTLKRINPADTDYGQCLSEGRRLLLDETLKNGYFWSNLIALALLGCLFITVVYQHRIQAKREWTMSEILAQFEQAAARSNQQVEEAAKKNRSLAESLAAWKQSAVRPLPPPADTVDRAPYRPTRSHTVSIRGRTETAPPKGDDPKPPAERPATAGVSTGSSGQIALFKPEVELVTKVNALEQQLGRSHDMEKQLRRQLNESGRKLQAEQEKNRSPKGA